MLVDATGLTFWANRRDAQALLPQLIRRLVYATTERILRSSFRSGEGIQLGGWDGIVVVEKGNQFVPDGMSCWEMGTTADAKGKADDDYEKRCANPGDVDPSKSAFVFITPRRWSGKDDWVTTRQAEGVWREVRVYDADDLEHWLEIAPAVHIWLSVLHGTHPEDAMDLGSFWEDWAAVTEPALAPEFVLSGRDEVTSKVHDWLRDPSATLALKAESRDESLAVFAAAVHQLPPDEVVAYLSRAIVVRELAAWHRLTAVENPLTLIPVFDSRDAVARATRTGHRVVIPLGPADSESDNTLNIPRLSRGDAMKALIASGLVEDRARELASLARRSLMSLRRKLALSPEVQQPEWARPAEALSLLPALLAGGWGDASEGDREAIATLAQGPYEEVSHTLVRWANETDPPVRSVSGAWFIASKEDVWSLLGRYLTGDDLRRFEQIAIEVLRTTDPRFDLPKDERYMAGVLGAAPSHSGLLRRELANTLAFMGARGITLSLAGSISTRDYAARVVRRLLELANADWRVWASLSQSLTLLAEAAPDAFLLAVENGLSGENPVLLRLFTEQEDALFGQMPHTGLLWALEVLAWDPEHLAHAALLLAKLARLDPGGKSANRPQESLRGIFLLWLPQTAATLDQRLRVLDVISEREPDISWRLLEQLLPKNHDVGHLSAMPQWREWAPVPERNIPHGEYMKGVGEVVTRMLASVGERGDRWSGLIWALQELDANHYELIVEHLCSLEVEHLQPSDRTTIWNALRRFISSHRSYSDADWALPKERIDALAEIFNQFEPQELAGRYSWLFDYSPSLPEGLKAEWHERERVIEEARAEAIRKIYERAGLSGVLELVGCVEQPFHLGTTLGESELAKDEEDELLGEHLASEDIAFAQFARGFVSGRIKSQAIGWAVTKLVDGKERLPAQRAEVIICLPFGQQTWQIAELFGRETDRSYWRLINPYVVGEANVEYAARKLLSHDRPHAAIELLSLHVRKGKGAPVTLIAEALERLLEPSPEDDRPSNSSSHNLSRLLNVLAASEEIDESRIARLEWAFLPLLGRFERQPEILHRELARNPEFFSDLVSLVFRAEGDEPREVSEDDQSRARYAYRLLRSWRTVPGAVNGRTLDAETLKTWIRRVRELMAASGRRAVGDDMLGQVLSGSPFGEDGTWPHPAVCDLIEEVASTDLEHGIEIGLYNSRGVVTKNPADGGYQERQIAERYAGFAAATRDRWLRTSAMLKRVSDGYQAQARHEDQDAQLRDELDL